MWWQRLITVSFTLRRNKVLCQAASITTEVVCFTAFFRLIHSFKVNYMLWNRIPACIRYWCSSLFPGTGIGGSQMPFTSPLSPPLHPSSTLSSCSISARKVKEWHGWVGTYKHSKVFILMRESCEESLFKVCWVWGRGAIISLTNFGDFLFLQDSGCTI